MKSETPSADQAARHHAPASKKTNPVKKVLGEAVAKLRADDDMLRVLDAHNRLEPLAIEKLDVAEARRQPTPADAVSLLLREDHDGGAAAPMTAVSTAEHLIPGPASELPATVYTPSGEGPFPVIVYFHGGGWVIADRKVYDGGARGLCQAAQAIVISVDYRQAPEHRFPAAWDDALAAYDWVSRNAAQFGGDPSRLGLAGESAGGCLAVATAIAARDRGLAEPRAVLAVYPVAQNNLSTVSYLENAIAAPLNRAMIPWFLDKLLRSEADLDDPRLNLVGADLHGLPPVTLINATLDPLRDDGALLEEALTAAGVPVERAVYDGVVHEFFGMAAVVEKAREAQAYAGERLREAFGEALPPSLH